MRLRGVGMTLTGAEGASPPLPYIDVADGEGAVLLALYPKGVAVVGEEVAEETLEALFGSSIQPAYIAIGDSQVQLGEVVRAACGDMTATEWNSTADSLRESLIAAEIKVMRREAGRDPDTNEEPNPEQVGNDTPPSEEDPAPPHAEHATDLLDAFELLDPETDLVATGARASKPKVGSIKDILERDVTAEEIDAAWAAKDAAA